MAFTVGNFVIVTMANRGMGPGANNNNRPPKIEAWLGQIVRPSVLHVDWWLVKRVRKDGRLIGPADTVPEREMKLTKVRA